MGTCELCGAMGSLFNTKIEGILMDACKRCSSHGQVQNAVQVTVKTDEGRSTHVFRDNEPEEESLVSDFSELIRKKRQSLMMDLKDFARRANERESVMQKIENGTLRPDIKTARKLERILNLRLVEIVKNAPVGASSSRTSDVLTLGDLMKMRK